MVVQFLDESRTRCQRVARSSVDGDEEIDYPVPRDRFRGTASTSVALALALACILAFVWYVT